MAAPEYSQVGTIIEGMSLVAFISPLNDDIIPIFLDAEFWSRLGYLPA